MPRIDTTRQGVEVPAPLLADLVFGWGSWSMSRLTQGYYVPIARSQSIPSIHLQPRQPGDEEGHPLDGCRPARGFLHFGSELCITANYEYNNSRYLYIAIRNSMAGTTGGAVAVPLVILKPSIICCLKRHTHTWSERTSRPSG